jgi:plastocyanin
MRRLAPLLLLALGLAACGGGGSGGSSGGGGGGQQQASSKPCPSGATVIHMKDIQFQPKTATVKVGGTVCWQNEDSVQHDAVADNNAFHSALFGQGSTFTWKADKAGKVTYVCTVHPNMTAAVTVTG